MTLEGSLDAFSLPDIFQLLSFTKKTGALRIVGPSSKGVVYFTTGSVTGAVSDVTRQALARRLVGSGLLDDAQLTEALDIVANDPTLGVGRAAGQIGALDEGVLHAQVTEQATDAVFDLLRWSRGDFAFDVDEPNPDDIGVSLNVEEVITEARGRMELWESLTKTVPGPDAVVGVALAPPAGEATLTGEEWSLLALADGRRTVADLVRLTGRGEFATVRTLAALADRKLVTFRRGDSEANDSVAGLLRRQAELSRLEGHAEPAAVAEPETETEPAPAPPAPTAPVQERPRPHAVPDVVPQRPEPIAPRRPEFPEALPTHGTAAVEPATIAPLIERDPSVNKSLLLRLIAGVRGL